MLNPIPGKHDSPHAHFGPSARPVRSIDLFPLECFLWGHRKDMVYWQKLYIREELLQSMRESAECMKGNGEIIRKIANSVL
jgi:hypothetical protein